MPFYALIRNRGERNCVARRNAKAGRNRLIQAWYHGGRGSISESARRRFRPFYIPHSSIFLPPSAVERPLANAVKREFDPDAGKSCASISSFSLFLSLAFLLNARFPDYARFSSLERLRERDSLSSRILRIGLASPGSGRGE